MIDGKFEVSEAIENIGNDNEGFKDLESERPSEDEGKYDLADIDLSEYDIDNSWESDRPLDDDYFDFTEFDKLDINNNDETSKYNPNINDGKNRETDIANDKNMKDESGVICQNPEENIDIQSDMKDIPSFAEKKDIDSQSEQNIIDQQENKNELNEGLTDEQKKDLKERTGWPDEIVDQIGSKEEADIYEKAGLVAKEINGKWCLVRNDIDMDQKDEDGITNKERMERGRPPLTKDGDEVELHHIGQKSDGPLAELTTDEHRGTGNDTILHDKSKESEINRNEFATERKNHWKARINE